MRYVYPAIFHPEENGEYSVWFPDLTGCVTQGNNLYDALYMAQDALNSWLEFLEDERKVIATPSDIKKISLEGEQFATYIRADTDAWRLLEAQRHAS